MHKELQRIRHGYYDLWFGTNAVYENAGPNHTDSITIYC